MESIYRFVIFRFIELRLVHMCGRYYRRSDKQRIGEAFNLGSLPPDFIFPDWNDNFAPNTFQPVIRNARETGERELVLMCWGMVPFLIAYWAKDPTIGLRTINGMAETITAAPAFREAIKYRRCLMPANAFYEWVRLDATTKQPFAIAMKDSKPYALRRSLGAVEGSQGRNRIAHVHGHHD
ncbi:MAG TPA: SOS response-associated peptidase [Edaphobacter sp.]|nr:SOS response-associated peptidase [Edaphobacter sp.]